jgi:hypothetical protein
LDGGTFRTLDELLRVLNRHSLEACPVNGDKDIPRQQANLLGGRPRHRGDDRKGRFDELDVDADAFVFTVKLLLDLLGLLWR